MPHKKGHKVTGKMTFRQRLDQMLHGDRLERKKAKESSKKTTVPDSQKRSMKSTATMSDDQKKASRANVTNRPDMSDAQKSSQTKAKNASDMSDAQKRGQISKGVKTVSDDRKKFQTYKNRDEVAKMFDRAKRKAGSSNKTTVSDAQKRTQTKSEPKTFKEAFRRARQEGKAKFTYKGKSYAAVTQDEVNKAFKAGKIKKKTLRAFLNMKKKK